jgi:hypothetical protein
LICSNLAHKSLKVCGESLPFSSIVMRINHMRIEAAKSATENYSKSFPPGLKLTKLAQT